MEPQTLEIIKDIIELLKQTMPDAIKIIGPALVTGYVAYKTAKIQYKSKLDEVTENHKFIAREHFLDYYNKKILEAGEVVNSLNLTLGSILGQMSEFESPRTVEDESEIFDTISTNLSMVTMYLESSSFELNTTLRDMKEIGLESSEEYRKLMEYRVEAKGLTLSKDTELIQQSILKLSEIYTFIGRCRQVVLEEQIHKLFGGFISKA